MLIFCAQLGTHWWSRTVPEVAGEDAGARSRSMIMNTTGIKRGCRIMRSWVIPGMVRFNLAGFHQTTTPGNLMQRLVWSPYGLEKNEDGRRLLLSSMSFGDTSPDAILIAVQSLMHGRITFGSDWKSKDVRVVSASAYKGEQEILVLMAPEGKIYTDEGTLGLKWGSAYGHRCVKLQVQKA